MFGHDDKQTHGNSNDQDNPALPDDGVLADDNSDDLHRPEEPPLVTPQPAGMAGPSDDGDDKDAADTKPVEEPKHPEPAAKPVAPSATVSPTAKPMIGSNPADLLSIKQDALKQLSPLVDHLNQTPEEKFRTMMMMIQAADNDNLIKPAYEAAQAIGDEKVRAQALLDIINEINYFTQQHADETA